MTAVSLRMSFVKYGGLICLLHATAFLLLAVSGQDVPAILISADVEGSVDPGISNTV